MIKLKDINWKYISLLLAFPAIYLLPLEDYSKIRDMVLGALLVVIANQVQKYGLKAMFLLPSSEQIDMIFYQIEEGNLGELKKIAKTIPHQQLVNFVDRTGNINPLIYAIDRDRREIVLWLIEIGADVNKKLPNNESPIERAIFRKNNVILKDLLENGASIGGLAKNLPINIILYSILKEEFDAVEIMLEANDHQWPDLSKSSQSVKKEILEKRAGDQLGEISAKQERWVRLRQLLKLQQGIGKGTTAAQKKLINAAQYPHKEMSKLNHNLMREIIKDYY